MDFQLPPVDNSVPSPCIGVCTLDFPTGACVGCGRTRSEIKNWPYLDGDAKRAALAAAQKRLETL